MGCVEAIGIDMVEIERLDRIVKRWNGRFLQRVFTAEELAYCQTRADMMASLAARFAAKEALFKALGTGWSEGLRWTDVAVINDDQGKPNLHLSGKARQLVADRRALVSISHTPSLAVAQVLLTRP